MDFEGGPLLPERKLAKDYVGAPMSCEAGFGKFMM